MTRVDPVAVRAHPDVRALHPATQRAYLALLVARERAPGPDGEMARDAARHAIRAALPQRAATMQEWLAVPGVNDVARALIAAGLLVTWDDDTCSVRTPAEREALAVFGDGAAAMVAQWAADTARAVAEADAAGVLGELSAEQWDELMAWVARERTQPTEAAA
jgi:hypothetical protein